MLLDLLISISTFLALLLVARLAFAGARRPAEVRIRALADGGVGTQPASAPFGERVILPLIDAVGSRLVSLLPGRLARRIEQRMVPAGWRTGASAFWALAFGSGALLAVSYVAVVLAASGGKPPAVALLPAAMLMIAGVLLSIMALSTRARARQRRLLRGLPDSLDLLTICVEVGLSLDAAFYQVAEKQEGPLGDELRTMLREISFGKSRREALLDLAERTQLDDVRMLVSGIIQAEQMGTSLAPILRAQAQRLRVRRRQRAERDARRAPVKMVFPLVFCLMPSLFIFILGPLIVSLFEFLEGR